MNTLKTFGHWLDVPLEEVDHRKMVQFIDWLLDKNLSPKTINCYLESIRIKTAQDSLRLINLAINRMLAGEIQTDTARVLIYGASTLTRCPEVCDLQKRLDELEAKIR